MARLLTVLATSVMLASCASPKYSHALPGQLSAKHGESEVEEIYIVRSLRVDRSEPGTFCNTGKTGFVAEVQDRFVFKAVLTRASDGKVIDARTQDAGALQACFGDLPDGNDTNFYAEALIAGISVTGKGRCTDIVEDFPESGITSVRCFLALSNLPKPYIGGVLTTNSIVSRKALGDKSDPPGYTQPSIATIRLWRKR